MNKAIEMVKYVSAIADEIDCKIALYNHRGWFGNPHNQVEIIKALPELNLTMVYNFHHAHEYLDDLAGQNQIATSNLKELYCPVGLTHV